MYIHLNEENIAIINDALKHVESTTDIYSELQLNETKLKYRDAFIDTYNKIQSVSNEDTAKGVYYFVK